MKVYIDGKFHAKEDARVSVFDHGLLYGDGVFEGIRIYDKTVFKLAEHLERLYASAKALMIDIPLAKEGLREAVLETVEANSKENGYIRLVVTRGEGQLGIDPASCRKASVIIIVDDLSLYPESYYRDGIAIVTSSTRRAPSDVLDAKVKSLNYLNNILAKMEAKAAGCMEAVMLGKDGCVAECTADNIFIVKDGALKTPAAFYGALDGITARTIIEAVRKKGMQATETALTRYDLYTADEVFMTGTGAEVVPVVKIDGRTIGDGRPGKATLDIKELFGNEVKRHAA